MDDESPERAVMSSSTGTPSQARRARPGPPNPLAAVASTSEEDAAATTGAPLPVALALAPSAAVFADPLTEAARPCHLYYVYEDDVRACVEWTDRSIG